MACAALVQIGPVRQSFWALQLPGGEIRERTRRLPRASEVRLERGDRGSSPPIPGRARVRDLGVELDLALEEIPGVQALCPHGSFEVWTRKQAGVRAHGTLTLDGEPRDVEALAVIDDTAGHHARLTEWRWSAGVGLGQGGVQVAWNLVTGVNDPREGSERAVWVGGEPREVPPVAFASDLSRITCEDGSELRFAAQSERRRRETVLLLSSDYRAPFGTFSGMLPGGIPLERGRGVVEHHRARW